MKVKDNSYIFSKDEKVFFTSDTHFNHKKIIEYCNRPFKSLEEMDEILIKHWNKVVGKDDYVFHLGDFVFGGSNTWKDVLSRLNGHIILIKGNHDYQNFRESYYSYFEHVADQMLIFIDDQPLLLNHYPILTYPKQYRTKEVIQLHGHVHSSNKMTGTDNYRYALHSLKQYDVGVDNNDYYPVSYSEIINNINERIKNYSLIDRLKQVYYCYKWVFTKS